MSKPFLLFGGAVYYASGGWWDFLGAYATQEEAQAAVDLPATWEHLARDEYDDETMWFHIVDLRSGALLEQR